LLKYSLNSSLEVRNIGDLISLKLIFFFLRKDFNLFSKNLSSISKKEIYDLAKILIRNKKIFILSDDIYEHVRYDNFNFFTIAQVSKLKDRTLTMNGVSKSYAMTGWRIGYAAGPKEIIKAIGKIVTVPQTLAFPISPQSIRTSNYNKPVQMVIYGNTYEDLEETQKKVIRAMRENPNLSRIESDYSRNKPEVKLIINKNKAKDLGVSTETVGKSLETLYGGKRVTTFNKLGKGISNNITAIFIR